MKERKAIALLLSRNMLTGFNVLMYSLLLHNKWLCNKDYDIVIFDDDLRLSDRIAIVTKFVECNIVFINVEKNNYNNVAMQKVKDRLKKTYYKLDMFRKIGEYERIVLLDVDIVVTGDISELFTIPIDNIAGVQAYRPKSDLLQNYINSGVLVISKNCIGENIYKDLIEMACDNETNLPDQDIINKYFNGRLQYLPKIYNVEKRMEHTKNYKNVLQNKKIVHYVNYKPWEDNVENDKYPEMISLWFDYYRKYINDKGYTR